MTSTALRRSFGVGFELLEIRAHLGAIDSVQLRIGFAGLRGLAELRQRLPQIIEAVGRPLAAGIVAVVGKQRLGRGASVAFVEKRPADEIVGVADPLVLGISGDERFQRADRVVIFARFRSEERRVGKECRYLWSRGW